MIHKIFGVYISIYFWTGQTKLLLYDFPSLFPDIAGCIHPSLWTIAAVENENGKKPTVKKEEERWEADAAFHEM